MRRGNDVGSVRIRKNASRHDRGARAASCHDAQPGASVGQGQDQEAVVGLIRDYAHVVERIDGGGELS
jgi:hypothetical protein